MQAFTVTHAHRREYVQGVQRLVVERRDYGISLAHLTVPDARVGRWLVLDWEMLVRLQRGLERGLADMPDDGGWVERWRGTGVEYVLQREEGRFVFAHGSVVIAPRDAQVRLLLADLPLFAAGTAFCMLPSRSWPPRLRAPATAPALDQRLFAPRARCGIVDA